MLTFKYSPKGSSLSLSPFQTTILVQVTLVFVSSAVGAGRGSGRMDGWEVWGTFHDLESYHIKAVLTCLWDLHDVKIHCPWTLLYYFQVGAVSPSDLRFLGLPCTSRSLSWFMSLLMLSLSGLKRVEIVSLQSWCFLRVPSGPLLGGCNRRPPHFLYGNCCA